MRLALLIPPIVWATAIFLVSSVPNPPEAGGSEVASYAAHTVEYAVLALLAARALATTRLSSAIAIAGIAVAVSTAYGLSDEWHQSFVPNRDASATDLAFDAAGAVIGAAAWSLASLLRRARLSARSA